MNDLIATNPAEAFRAKAAEGLISAAGMTLHQLVDEYVRLTEVIEANVVKTADDEEWGARTLNDVGKLASRERGLIDGAAKVRFGISFAEYDRTF